MAKKKTGLLEDVAGIAATFPWWVGCVLAALAYGVLHRYAASEAVSSAVPGQVGQLVIKRMPGRERTSATISGVVRPSRNAVASEPLNDASPSGIRMLWLL